MRMSLGLSFEEFPHSFKESMRSLKVGVQSFKGKDHKQAENPENWENLFLGTEEECHRYATNLHHAIDPNMLDKFDPRKDVKRILN